MRSKSQVGIWGQFGSGEQIADGQAVRTTIITQEISKRYGRENVNILNTNRWSKNPIFFFLKTILLAYNSKKVIIFPADNGFKVIVPLLELINILFKRELYYVIIGGFLPTLLLKNKKYLNKLKKYKALFAQTEQIKRELEQLGLNNVHILSNLKNLEKLDTKDIHVRYEKKLEVCTFSRVTETKGIEDAIQAVGIANQKLREDCFSLDIYGVIDKKFEKRFEELLSKNSGFVKYKGVIDYDKTVETLKKYFLLLFPTYYHGEGFPGNFIDAFHSGLPIVASNWLYNKEIIKDMKNGLIVPVKDPVALSEALILLYENRELTHDMALQNLKEAKKYTPQNVLSDFFKIID